MSDETAPEDTGTPSVAAPDAPAKGADPATNLLIADIVVRGAARLFSETVEQRVGKPAAVKGEEDLTKLDGRTLLTTLGLYGASRLANRSLAGLALVAGGLIAKSLYDRGKAKQLREAGEEAEAQDEVGDDAR